MNKKIKKYIISSLIFTNLLTSSGCTKNIDCNIEENHAHYYVSEESGLSRPIDSEKERTKKLNRTEDYVIIDENDEDLLKFINKNNLFYISNNIDAINNIVSSNHDYIEYRYKYLRMQKVGNSNVPITSYSWTNNPNRGGCTGETRLCHYVYHGYKIVKNEKGKYELVKSDNVDNIFDLGNDYFIKGNDFIDIVYSYNQDKELDNSTENEEYTEEGMTRKLIK